MSRKDEKDVETMLAAGGVYSIALGAAACAILGPVGVLSVAAGVANVGISAAFAADRTEKENAIREKYEGSTQRLCDKKEVPSEIRRSWNEQKQKKK